MRLSPIAAAVLLAAGPASAQTWTKVADEGQAFTVTGTIRYGVPDRWRQQDVTAAGSCSNAFFGGDPAPNVVKRCERLTPAAPAPAPSPTASRVSIVTVTPPAGVTVKVTRRTTDTSKQVLLTVNKSDVVTVVPTPAPLPPPDHTMTGPAVDLNSVPAPAIGFSDRRWAPIPAGCNQDNPTASDKARCDTNVWIAYPSDLGAFRVPCSLAMMIQDDPLVLPGQPGASHWHFVYGNTGFSANSTQATLSSSGNSTCHGGTLVRSAMWVPAVIDERGRPVVLDLNYYQKNSYEFDISAVVQPVPSGLRVVVGDAKNTDPKNTSGRFLCIDAKGANPGWKNTITQAVADGTCTPGGMFYMSIGLPYCWDGKNLDSPDHRSHMSYTVQDGTPPFAKHCPASHPVVLPNISFQLTHVISAGESPSRWYLASDMQTTMNEAGVSVHGDYWANLDPELEATIAQKCLREKRDGHDDLTCDGRTLYGANPPPK